MRQFKIFSFATVLLFATAISFSSTGCSPNDASKENTAPKAAVTSLPAMELKTSMRKLWEEHVFWTRNVILCITDELPGTEQSVKRLMQNQVDLGNALKTYYGEENAKKITELLYAHVTTSADVIKAATAGDSILLQTTNKKWYANADEIAVLLSQVNPHWTLAEMKMMMDNHLKLTADEVTQRVAGNYEADVLAFDKVHNEILKMSDMLSNGIIKQFPEKF